MIAPASFPEATRAETGGIVRNCFRQRSGGTRWPRSRRQRGARHRPRRTSVLPGQRSHALECVIARSACDRRSDAPARYGSSGKEDSSVNEKPGNHHLRRIRVANVCRLLAYLPQISVLLKQSDVAAVSSATWLLFCRVERHHGRICGQIVADTAMALTFTANTICCGTIVTPTWLASRLGTNDARKRRSDWCSE